MTAAPDTAAAPIEGGVDPGQGWTQDAVKLRIRRHIDQAEQLLADDGDRPSASMLANSHVLLARMLCELPAHVLDTPPEATETRPRVPGKVTSTVLRRDRERCRFCGQRVRLVGRPSASLAQHVVIDPVGLTDVDFTRNVDAVVLACTACAQAYANGVREPLRPPPPQQSASTVDGGASAAPAATFRPAPEAEL